MRRAPERAFGYSSPMQTSIRQAWFGFLFTMFAFGCGVADIGEACNGVGSTGDCVDGAICTDEGADGTGAGAVCRRVCNENADCASTEACLPVSNNPTTTSKSCQPR